MTWCKHSVQRLERDSDLSVSPSCAHLFETVVGCSIVTHPTSIGYLYLYRYRYPYWAVTQGITGIYINTSIIRPLPYRYVGLLYLYGTNSLSVSQTSKYGVPVVLISNKMYTEYPRAIAVLLVVHPHMRVQLYLPPLLVPVRYFYS